MACRELLLAICVSLFLSAGVNAKDCKRVSSMAGHMKAANIDKCYEVRVQASTSGKVWGTVVYKSDSDIGTAAVHSGLFKAGETEKVLRIELAGGTKEYKSTSRHGIRTSSYNGSWPLSYYFPDYIISNMIMRMGCKYVSPMSGHFKAANIGKCYTLKLKGVTSGKVWGDNVYTDDSDIGTAAVHADALIAGTTWNVKLKVLPGRNSYESATHNGIKTRKYGKWDLSYTFV